MHTVGSAKSIAFMQRDPDKTNFKMASEMNGGTEERRLAWACAIRGLGAWYG